MDLVDIHHLQHDATATH